jgi:hypothetical protein
MPQNTKFTIHVNAKKDLREIDTTKVCQISIWGYVLCLQYEQLTYLKIFLSSLYRLRFLTVKFSRCKNLVTYGPGPQINLIPGAGLIFFIHFRVCSLEKHLSSGCHPCKNYHLEKEH